MFEDFIQGFFLGQLTAFVIGPFSLLVGVVTGVLWILGGMGYLSTNLWRRAGISVIMATIFAIAKHSWVPMLAFPTMWLAMAQGYGTVDVNDSKGSWLGRIFGQYTRFAWWIILLISTVPLWLK